MTRPAAALQNAAPCPRTCQTRSRSLLSLEALAAVAFTAFRVHRRRAALPPPPTVEASHGGGHHRRPFSPRFPVFPRARLLTEAPRSRLAAVRLPRPPAPCLNPLDVFPSLLSFSQAKPESNPWLESCLRDFPMSRRREASPPVPSAAAP
jgi:hypothetical protein